MTVTKYNNKFLATLFPCNAIRLLALPLTLLLSGCLSQTVEAIKTNSSLLSTAGQNPISCPLMLSLGQAQLSTEGDTSASPVLIDSSNTLYIGSGGQNGYTLKSYTNGSWSTLDTGAGSIAALALDPAGNLYSAINTGMGWMIRKRAANTTTNWTTVDVSSLASNYTALKSDSIGNLYDLIYDYSVIATPRWIVRKSSDQGSTWTTLETYQYSNTAGTYPTGLLIDASNAITVYGSAGDPTPPGYRHWIVRKSNDGGASWTNVDDLSVPQQNLLPQSGLIDSNGYIYISGMQQLTATTYQSIIRKSANNAATWSTVSTINEAVSGILQTDGAGKLLWIKNVANPSPFFGTRTQILQSIDQGGTWNHLLYLQDGDLITSNPQPLTQYANADVYTSVIDKNGDLIVAGRRTDGPLEATRAAVRKIFKTTLNQQPPVCN